MKVAYYYTNKTLVIGVIANGRFTETSREACNGKRAAKARCIEVGAKLWNF
jgi:hypothetical protein